MKTMIKTKSLKTSKKKIWLEYIKTIAIAFILVFGFMRPFVVEAYRIPSGSMEDTLLVGDRIMVAKFAYGINIPGTDIRILDLHRPKIGDIFVFDAPPMCQAQLGKKEKLIKRVVGIPGDVIELRNGELYRNGIAVEGENYIRRIPNSQFRNMDFGPVQVPPENYFAMGDNRDNSNDSRFWGYVPFENVKGQAFLTYWSWNSEADWLHKIRFARIGHLLG